MQSDVHVIFSVQNTYKPGAEIPRLVPKTNSSYPLLPLSPAPFLFLILPSLCQGELRFPHFLSLPFRKGTSIRCHENFLACKCIEY